MAEEIELITEVIQRHEVHVESRLIASVPLIALIVAMLLPGMGVVAAQAANAVATRPTYADIVERAVIMGATTYGFPYARSIAEQSNAAALKTGFDECRHDGGGGAAGTFTAAGYVSSIRHLSNVRFRPKGPMVSCFALVVEQLHFPRPPQGTARWPVAIEYDSTNGSVLDVSEAYRAKSVLIPSIPPPSPDTQYPTPYYMPSPHVPLGLDSTCQVVIGMMVDAEGMPHDPVVKKPCGSIGANSAALDAIRQWQFIPTMVVHPVAIQGVAIFRFIPGV